MAWNTAAASEKGYRKAETPREYFGKPATDPRVVPLEPDPEAANATPTSAGDDQPSGVKPTANASEETRSPTEIADDGDLYHYLGTATRGWTDEIIDAKKLGWAPPNSTALFEHLREKGFERHTMLATGMFTAPSELVKEDVSGNEVVNFEAVDEPGPLRSTFRARYVFPYFDEEGRVAALIARKPDFDTEDGTHPNDYVVGKYAKLSTSKPYAITSEPIYGLQTIREGEPVVITEGMADAITAHSYGIPCISPVTIQFSLEDRDGLAEILAKHKVPDVYFLQDSDPPQVVKPAEESLEYDEDALERAMIVREIFTPGDLPEGLTESELVAAHREDRLGELLEEADIEVGPSEVPIHLFVDEIARPKQPGPISEVLTIGQHGPGVGGAVTVGEVLDAELPSANTTETGRHAIANSVYEDHVIDADDGASLSAAELRDELERRVAAENASDDEDSEDHSESAAMDEEASGPTQIDPAEYGYPGTDVWIVELPQFGDEKRDLDDYLQEGWISLIPPAPWALSLVMDDYPISSAVGGVAQTPPWIGALADRENHFGEHPFGIDPRCVLFPAAHTATTETYGAAPQSAAGSSPVYESFIATDALSEQAAPLTDLEELGSAVSTDTIMNRVQQGQLTTQFHHASLFGLLPAIKPSEHPAATGKPLEDTDGSEMEVDPQEIEDRTAKEDWRKIRGEFNPLWSLDLTDLGFKVGFRGKNPFGHHGESENYFKVFERNGAYCFKNKARYNATTSILVEVGERSRSDPNGELSGWEKFQVWKYAHKKGVVPAHTPLPIDGIIGYALHNELATPDDLEPVADSTPSEEGDEGSGRSDLKWLPTKVYVQTLEHIHEEHGVTPPQFEEIQQSSSDDSKEADTMTWDEAVTEFGAKFGTGSRAPEPLEQFIFYFVEEDDSVDDPGDSEMVVPRKEFREGYNTWIDLVNEYYDNLENHEPTDLEKPAASIFGRKLNKVVDIEKARPVIEGDQVRCYSGIQWNERGEKIAAVEE